MATPTPNTPPDASAGVELVEFDGLMKNKRQHSREAVRWGADYLLKATAHPDTIYVQASRPLLSSSSFLNPHGQINRVLTHSLTLLLTYSPMQRRI